MIKDRLAKKKNSISWRTKKKHHQNHTNNHEALVVWNIFLPCNFLVEKLFNILSDLLRELRRPGLYLKFWAVLWLPHADAPLPKSELCNWKKNNESRAMEAQIWFHFATNATCRMECAIPMWGWTIRWILNTDWPSNGYFWESRWNSGPLAPRIAYLHAMKVGRTLEVVALTSPFEINGPVFSPDYEGSGHSTIRTAATFRLLFLV